MKPECSVVAPVFLEYKSILTRFINSRVKDPVDTQDVLSEVLLKVYDNCADINEIRQTEAWLITIARNSVNDYFRQHQKQLQTTEEVLPEADDEDLYASLIACIPSLISKLPTKYAEPLRLYELEGIAQNDLAKQFSMSHSGIKSRIQRGRKMLKSMFIEHCGNEVASSKTCGHTSCDCQ
jgi:RNA polymerase sigma-70 factor (ECF subfamily)